jgi:threonine aldolase
VCNENNLKFHLDGARLFNAMVEKKETPKQYGEIFDSISICLSKGLGCPVGSLLLGRKDFIKKARRVRKVFGGGMRQAGFLAAAGIYALQNHVERLKDDHEHARQIGCALQKKSFVKLLLPVETNIIIIELNNSMTAPAFVQKMKEKDILPYAITPNRVRFVVHLDITEEMIEKTVDMIGKM